MTHSVNSGNPGHSDSDNYGFRIDMSPGTTVCSNLASETGPYPNTSVNATMQIGDPFDFHGNCAPSTFKLNTMNNSTARGLYMGGINNGQGSNGVVIGDQGTFGIPHDNFWNPLAGFHTDYNNVEGNMNKFYMNNCPVFINNGQGGGLINTFQCNSTNGTVSCGGLPFFVDTTHDAREIDVYDDIARDSTSNLGGNDTTRYFGKEFLYSQIKGDSTLLNYQALSTFKDSVELSNAKHIDALKQGLIFPIDSLAKDSLLNKVSIIQPANNIENYYKEVFELALQNPELKDSVYSTSDLNRLRTIARLCPFMDGSAVYSARVILHAFEPDSTYYNYCEFAKRSDRETSERFANQNENNDPPLFNRKIVNYQLIPNPNNGSFILQCPGDEAFQYNIFDSRGKRIMKNFVTQNQNVVSINMSDIAPGLYNFVITTNGERFSIKFNVIQY